MSSSIPVNIGNTANLIALIVNNGKADLRGVEFEGEFRVTQELRLAATFGYNDTEVKSFGVQANGLPNCADCLNAYGSFDGVIGNQLPSAPKVTYGLSADYERQLTGDLNWFARANFTHQGKKYTDLSNVAWVGDSNYLNLSFGIRNETWSVTAFANNVTEDDTLLAAAPRVDALTFGIVQLGSPLKNELSFSAPMPRSYGLRFTYNF